MANGMAESSSTSGGQVRLRLTTKDPDLSLSEDSGVLLVPTAFRRYALSTLVNNLLHAEKPIPLEFLVNGSYLRTSLDEYLTSNGISAETILSIEYTRARVPPVFIASFEHDDWVSSVDAVSTSRNEGRILSASWDGLLRVWNTSGQVIATSLDSAGGGHAASIKSARFISPSQVVSSAMDRSIRVWKFQEDIKGFSASLEPQIELYGHTSSVDSVDVNSQGTRILSASADKTVSLWSTQLENAPPAEEFLIPASTRKGSKRRKLNASVSTPQRGPLAVFQPHNGPVAGAIFDSKDSTVGYSASQDHSLRTWDLTTTALVDTRTVKDYSLCSVEQLPDLNLVAVGTIGANDIKLIDVRDSATSISAMTLKGHRNMVGTLARDPNSIHSLLSGSHDGTCRVWDVRSTKNTKDGVVGRSVYTIKRESLGDKPEPVAGLGVQVYGVCWDKNLGILSGGQDKQVQMNKGDSLMSGTTI